MLYKIKSNFEVMNDGSIIPEKVWIENSNLHIVDGENHHKFEGGKWFVKTPLTNNEFIFLGVGALPGVEIEKVGVLDETNFNALFEEKVENIDDDIFADENV